MKIERIAFPHPAFSEVGPRLLMKEFAPAQAADLELFITKNLRGLELICTYSKCGELNSLKDFSCPTCSSSLEFRQDLVIEDSGVQRVKPNTLRIWCTGINWMGKPPTAPCPDAYSSAVNNLPWYCNKPGCEGKLTYGLAGNETSELMFAFCLELANRVTATTNFYQATLSAGSASKALELLVNAEMLETQKTKLTLSRTINKPNYYEITNKGLKKLAGYRKKFSDNGLLGIFDSFVNSRIATMRDAEPTKDYELLKSTVRRLRTKDFPEGVRTSLLIDSLSEEKLLGELATYATEFVHNNKTEQMPGWLAKFYGINTINCATNHKRTAHHLLYEAGKKVGLTEEVTMLLLNERASRIKSTGLLKLLLQYLENDMLRPAEEVFLRTLFASPKGGVELNWLGMIQIYSTSITGEHVEIYHVAETDVKHIMQSDYRVVWIKSGLKEIWEQMGLARAGR